MTNTTPLGQRLRKWREANNVNMLDAAEALQVSPAMIAFIENVGGSSNVETCRRIEALIATNPDHDAIVAGAVEVIRAALAAGCTSVHIIRPETPERGRVTVLLGDVGNDPEWRKWI